MQRFSKRYGYAGAPTEITIREEAPEELRALVLSSLRRYAGASHARQLVCSALRKLPDRGNWSDGNVWDEALYHVENCDWYKVYDLIEAIYADISTHRGIRGGPDHYGPSEFSSELNELMEDRGVGWKLEQGRILSRGTESFEMIVSNAPAALQGAGMQTASDEIHKAIEDLSKRPTPDLTGAVQHGIAALECAGKHICGMTGRQTLDDVVKARPDTFRPPLHEAIPKLWGFANNRGRHLLEGGEPTYAEVELVVGVAATVATYLSRVARAE